MDSFETLLSVDRLISAVFGAGDGSLAEGISYRLSLSHIINYNVGAHAEQKAMEMCNSMCGRTRSADMQGSVE
ncbi:MAG: hypothetical protein NPIRA03_40040 [Nitrospirales bacterium]|nr:MAG: hypothetical protein NPIRA03_40040 [Nitrospirales bacterium]